jgi:predicted secreted protein
MTASVAVSGFGTLFTWNTVDVAELSNISGPTESADAIEVTNHGSPDAFREFIAGLRNGGEVSIEGSFIKGDTTGQIAMHTDFQAGTKRAFIIKMPGWVATAPQVSGYGILTAFEAKFPYDDKISFSATMKVTGKPVLAPA